MLLKELKSLLYSLSGLIFILIFLIINGCLLWIVPGNFNILENGYASMAPFFALTPFLLIFFIPAIGMRTFSEEKRNHTLSLLFTRPVKLHSIIISKLAAVWITVIIALVPTVIYVLSIYFLGNPVGNIDLGAISASYIGLLCMALFFSGISVFSSALSSNQTISLIIGLLFSALLYFGFDLIAGMFTSGNVQLFIRELGLHSRYQSIQKGLVDFSDLWYLLAITVLFFTLTHWVVGKKVKSPLPIVEMIAFVLLISCSYLFQIRTDWTKDKRYTLSQPTKDLLSKVDSPIEMELFLDGNLNAGFTRLKKETGNIIEDFNRASNGKISVKTNNPYSVKGMVDALEKQNVRGIAVNEKDAEGTLSQKIIYPWLKVKYKDAETMVYLLVNQKGKSGEENLNTSIELLEYNLAHGIQLVSENKNRKVVFIEGHGELEEPYLEDITYQLSSSFQIDRGTMTNQIEQLNGYDLVIIAGPQLPYTEEEKYILDQYLMQGGRILWLISGVQLQSVEAIMVSGQTGSRVNEVNLEDMLFKYGVHINPVLIQDTQCQNIPINNDTTGSSTTKYTLKPWYYAPLLIPNQDNPITKGIPLIKSSFTSSLSFTGNKNQVQKDQTEKNENINKQILLTSSEYSHLIQVPEMISLQETDRKPDKTYFNESYLPVAALLEGKFNSVFINRIPPVSVETGGQAFRSSSAHTKMIVIASEEIIRNDNGSNGSDFKPMGYDPYSGVVYGNSSFITNAISYLTDDSGLINLRNKTLNLSLLDKTKIRENKQMLLLCNVVFPPVIIFQIFLLFSWRRNVKYKKDGMVKKV